MSKKVAIPAGAAELMAQAQSRLQEAKAKNLKAQKEREEEEQKELEALKQKEIEAQKQKELEEQKQRELVAQKQKELEEEAKKAAEKAQQAQVSKVDEIKHQRSVKFSAHVLNRIYIAKNDMMNKEGVVRPTTNDLIVQAVIEFLDAHYPDSDQRARLMEQRNIEIMID